MAFLSSLPPQRPLPALARVEPSNASQHAPVLVDSDRIQQADGAVADAAVRMCQIAAGE